MLINEEGCWKKCHQSMLRFSWNMIYETWQWNMKHEIGSVKHIQYETWNMAGLNEQAPPKFTFGSSLF